MSCILYDSNDKCEKDCKDCDTVFPIKDPNIMLKKAITEGPHWGWYEYCCPACKRKVILDGYLESGDCNNCDRRLDYGVKG